jgi:SprB repeat/Secretion system C-terminal sorting domain
MIHYFSQKLTLGLTLFLSAILPLQFAIAQCTHNSVWGGIGAPTTSIAATISNCNYAGEQATVTNLQAANSYILTSSNCLDYISIYTQTGTLVGFGPTPLTINVPMDGSYNVHFSANENCGTQAACRLTQIHCLSCGATPGCTDEEAINYNTNATYDDCSCILPNLPNDNCAGAISLDAWLNISDECTLSNISSYSGATAGLSEISPSIECSDGDDSPEDVWYSLNVPSSGAVAFEFVSTPGFSSIVECYTGSCGALTPYAPVRCNNDAERIFNGLTPGSRVYFRVWDYGSNDLGSHEICVRGEIPGCTNPAALNYNPNATLNDGSCNFPSASKPCTAAILTVNGPCVVGDNTGLSTEAGEPNSSCFVGENNTRWYRFIAQSSYTTISTDFTGYTNGNTEVALYTVGSCFNYNSYQLVACDQDGGVTENNNAVIANAATNIGQVYYIQVSGWDGAEGTFCIRLTSPPPNDLICGASLISCGNVKTGNTGLFSMNNSNLPAESCGTELTSPNAFYILNGTGSDVHLSLCNSSFDTRVNVFCLTSGSCGANPVFTCVGSNDDSPGCNNNTNATLRFATEEGRKYYIMVHGSGTDVGNFELSVTCNNPATPPANQDCVNDDSVCRSMGTAASLSLNNLCLPVTGSTVGAAAIRDNPACVVDAYDTYSNVWYKINTGDYNAFEIILESNDDTDIRQSLHTACNAEPMFCDESIVYGLSENTNYYIRVFTRRTEEGSFTICAKPVEYCAFMTSPFGNSVDVNAVLTWSPTIYADGYELMIGTSSGAGDVMSLTDVGNVTSYDDITFDYNTTYYVTIIPYADGAVLPTCPGFSFTTACPLITSMVSLLENDCLGQSDGGIDISVSGGVGPYAYNWEGPNGYVNFTQDIVQVAAGDYTVQIFDQDNGCEIVKSYNIPEAEPIVAQVNTVGQACANDGVATVVPSGGTEPYSYLWNNGATNAQINNMPTGIYNVVITDALGCSTTIEEILIPNDGGISTAVPNINGVGCGSANGSITLSPLNGEAPYSYSWISLDGSSEGSIANINGAYVIDNLSLGTYNITVTDVNGCNGLLNLINVEIIEDLEPEVAVLQNVTCRNQTNGMIEVATDYGAAPFQFNWSNGVSQVSTTGTAMIQNLSGGSYSVTVTDANGCVGEKTGIVVFEPNALNLSIAGVDEPICYGDLTGGIKTHVEGGVPPYSFTWSNGSTGNDLINVGFGTYSLTVTDQNGCEAFSFPINIESVSDLEMNVTGVVSLACFNDNDGIINTNTSGGNPPYTFSWNNGATASSLNNLPGGNYQCTITDSKGCTLVSNVITVNAPTEAVSVAANQITTVSCNDLTDGAIDLNVSGGTTPYQYNWSNGANTQNIQNLQSGNYLVTVTDANNCLIISDIYFVAEPEPMTANNASTNELDDLGNGTATVTVNGGNAPYSYQWDAAAGSQTTAVALNLSTGNYSVTVTDANECQFVTTVTVGHEISSPVNTYELTNSVISRMELYPNPTKRDAQLLLDLSEWSEIDIQIFDITGKVVLGAQHYEAEKLLTVIDLSGEPEGVYLIKVKVNEELRTLLLAKQE